MQMLYGGLRLRDTESIQANTDSQVFMGTTRMRQQWFPGRFFSNRKRPGYKAKSECTRHPESPSRNMRLAGES